MALAINIMISAVERNEDQQTLFIPSWLQQRSQPPSLGFGRDSKAGRGERKLLWEKKGRLRCALMGGSWPGEVGPEVGHPM